MAGFPPPNRDDIAARFDFHPAQTPERGQEHEAVREAFKTVALFLVDNVPAGRHHSLALTHLEEAMHWSNAAVAFQKEPS